MGFRVKTIPMSQIKRLNKKRGQFWFNPDTLRFFKSRLPDTAIKVGEKAYFVSSEQNEEDDPRLYSIRVCDLQTGRVNTVGEFQQYRTSEAAHKALTEITSE